MDNLSDIMQYIERFAEYLKNKWLWIIGIMICGLIYGIYLIIKG